jgi:hypothetical protein
MLEPKEIIEKGLKDGRDYLYIGGERYRPDDCILSSNGQEITIKKIIDQVHFLDQRNSCLHSHMFYDRKWEHCPERNADKKTKGRTQFAVIADRARIEREKFKGTMTDNKPWQIYESYQQINFFEQLCWHFVKREYDQNSKESAALLKASDEFAEKGLGILEGIYRHVLYNGNTTAATRFDIVRVTDDFINKQQEMCSLG